MYILYKHVQMQISNVFKCSNDFVIRFIKQTIILLCVNFESPDNNM